MPDSKHQDNSPKEVPEDVRRAYIERIRSTSHQITESVRRSEQLSAADYAVQVNAKD